MNFEVLVSELANVGLMIFSVVVGILIVNWLDKNVLYKNPTITTNTTIPIIKSILDI